MRRSQLDDALLPGPFQEEELMRVKRERVTIGGHVVYPSSI